MRVAYVISTLDRCGPVNVLYDIIKFLPSDIEAAVFTMAQEPPTSRLDDFVALGIDVTQVCSGRVSSMLAGGYLLKRALRGFKPDVVHPHGFRPYLACQGIVVPVVATVHNCIYEDFLTTYGKRRATWMTKKEVSALKTFAAVVACSESNAAYLRTEYGFDPIVVRNGVDQNRFLPLAATPRNELREKLGLQPGTTVLVATGGCSEWKRTLPLVEENSSALKNTGVDAELHVFGEGPLYEQCKNLAVPGVVFHGFVDDVVPWLQASDLFVSASASEGMPLAVLEALSCGLPALLSDIPPHREIRDILEEQNYVALIDGSAVADIGRALTFCLDGEKFACPKDVESLSSYYMSSCYCSVYLDLIGAD